MIFATPIWLFALAAVSIPVVIHLWNIKPGKTLKVGSIALFSESSPKSSRSFKLMDILLLMMRCLLLSLLALLLAYPLWQQHLQSSKAKGWLLIPQADLNEAYHQYKSKIDSLTKAGYEFHYFGKDFEKQDLNELMKAGPTATKTKDALDYWLLVSKLSSKITPGTNAELFTPNGISHFQGDKPQTALHINWHTYTPADSVSNFLSAAWLTPNGAIRVVQGTAKPSGTTYQYTDIKNGGRANPAYDINIEAGIPTISLKNNSEIKIKVDTTIQHIAVYSDKNTADIGYLKAALDAIGQLTQRRTVIKQYDQPNIPAGQDWIFWLSDKPVEKDISYRAKNFFEYEAGKPVEINTWISAGNSITQGHPKITLYKSVNSTADTAIPVWTDGFGNKILSMEPGKTNHYYFYGHFSPAWSDLVWSDDFPKWLLDLTLPSVAENKYDNRTISADQLQPVHIDNTVKGVSAGTKYLDLTHYLWLLLALLFFAERWLATRNQTVSANG